MNHNTILFSFSMQLPGYGRLHAFAEKTAAPKAERLNSVYGDYRLEERRQIFMRSAS